MRGLDPGRAARRLSLTPDLGLLFGVLHVMHYATCFRGRPSLRRGWRYASCVFPAARHARLWIEAQTVTHTRVYEGVTTKVIKWSGPAKTRRGFVACRTTIRQAASISEEFQPSLERHGTFCRRSVVPPHISVAAILALGFRAVYPYIHTVPKAQGWHPQTRRCPRLPFHEC